MITEAARCVVKMLSHFWAILGTARPPFGALSIYAYAIYAKAVTEYYG